MDRARIALEHFARIAPPYLEPFKRNTCIEQTRILLECLKRVGVPGRPEAVRLVVQCEALKLVFVSGSTAKERERARRKGIDITELDLNGKPIAPCGQDTDQNRVGHVVAVINGRYLADPTLSQASMPDHGLTIEREIVFVGPFTQQLRTNSEVAATFSLNSGQVIDVRWALTGRWDFRKTAAWEPSHLWPIIDEISAQMKEALLCRA